MKTRWLLGMFVLFAAMLACDYPFQKEPSYTMTKINSVVVTPPSGTGSFTLEVSYATYWIPEKQIPDIHCYYVSPDLVKVDIGTVDMFMHIGAREVVTATKTLPFTIAQKNGVTPPGNYLAGCTTEIDNITVNTNFTVVGDTTPTPTLTEFEPALTSTPQLSANALTGRIIFDYTGYQSNRLSGGGELDWVTRECIPEVKITDGLINGDCEKAHTAARLADESFSAQVTGRVDQDGNVAFFYEVSEIGNPDGVWRISYDGQGSFTSSTQASGMASFSFSCASGQENLLWCNGQTDESFSGTIPWSFVPSQ